MKKIGISLSVLVAFTALVAPSVGYANREFNGKVKVAYLADEQSIKDSSITGYILPYSAASRSPFHRVISRFEHPSNKLETGIFIKRIESLYQDDATWDYDRDVRGFARRNTTPLYADKKYRESLVEKMSPQFFGVDEPFDDGGFVFVDSRTEKLF